MLLDKCLLNMKKLDESHQRIKNYEKHISDDKIKNDVLNKVLQNNEIQEENDD